MKKYAVTTVDRLIYRHYVYQENTLEGSHGPKRSKESYDKWSNWCIITAITPTYIKIELPDKTKPSKTVSYYTDYKIYKGLWLVFADFGADTEQFFWCRNCLQALCREWLCRARCSAPYLIHTIDWR